MSYILNDHPDQGPPPTRRLLIIAAAVIGVLALLATAFFLGRTNSDPATDPAWPTQGPAANIKWAHVAGQPVPVSSFHGPALTENELASGFSHDELGAVLAAIHISTRLTAQVGPAVYEATLREQCFGDIDATLASIRALRSSAAPGATIPTEVFYRIASGDPRSDLVAVSIALVTPQSTGMGGYAEISRTLQWIGGDWKVQVPPAPPQLITAVDDYTSLGRPDA